MKHSTVDMLASYIDALHPIIDGDDSITTEKLIATVKDTKSISNTLKEKIESIKKTIQKIDIKPASRIDEH